MIRQSYMDFVVSFGYLNPYELDHMSEAVFNRFDDLLHAAGGDNAKMPFTLQDIKHVVTVAMRDVQIELAEAQMHEAKIHLEKARAQTFAPRKITKEDEARTAKLSLHNANSRTALGEVRKKQPA